MAKRGWLKRKIQIMHLYWCDTRIPGGGEGAGLTWTDEGQMAHDGVSDDQTSSAFGHPVAPHPVYGKRLAKLKRLDYAARALRVHGTRRLKSNRT